MNEIECERLSELLQARVDAAHDAWLRQPTNGKRRSRYEDALAGYISGRQDIVDRLFDSRRSGSNPARPTPLPSR